MKREFIPRLEVSIFLIFLIVLSFFLLRKILLSIIGGILLAFIFSPLYKLLCKRLKNKTLVALLICFIPVFLIVIPFWFLIPLLIEQSLKLYFAVQNLDFQSIIKEVFPPFFSSLSSVDDVSSILFSFTSKSLNKLMNFFTEMLFSFPTFLLHMIVVLFTFFFVLRDQEEILRFLRSISPFSERVNARLLECSKGIASAVLFGQVIVGSIQGLVIGLGFFLFKAPNALLFTILAILAGIFPVIGTMIVWLPVAIYLFVTKGITFQLIGILIFGVLSSNIDNFLRPLFVSKRVKLHTGLVFAGMIGGLLTFGILGLVIGPLVLAYLVIFLEIYQKERKLLAKRKTSVRAKNLS